MTPFEKQVAEALDTAMARDVAAALSRGRWTPGELLAPRVAAAIKTGCRSTWDGAIEELNQDDACEIGCTHALIALRGREAE